MLYLRVHAQTPPYFTHDYSLSLPAPMHSFIPTPTPSPTPVPNLILTLHPPPHHPHPLHPHPLPSTLTSLHPAQTFQHNAQSCCVRYKKKDCTLGVFRCRDNSAWCAKEIGGHGACAAVYVCLSFVLSFFLCICLSVCLNFSSFLFVCVSLSFSLCLYLFVSLSLSLSPWSHWYVLK